MSSLSNYDRKDALERIKSHNLQNAEVAAAVTPMLAAQLAEDAMTTDDPELRRKIYDTLSKAGQSVEPKAAPTAQLPQLFFNIVLDPNVPQVPPPNKRAAMEHVEEVPKAEQVALLPANDDDIDLSDYA